VNVGSFRKKLIAGQFTKYELAGGGGGGLFNIQEAKLTELTEFVLYRNGTGGTQCVVG
jgi:hypothetical protein